MKLKEANVVAAEKREATALHRYMSRENYIVYHTIGELMAELGMLHDSGKAMYSPAMKCDVVMAQLQFRRDCLLRVLRPGALCSNIKDATRKLDALLDSFGCVIDDEHLYPSLLNPPQVRRAYQSHPFANAARRGLDEDRNEVTREMTRHFLETFEGGVFLGWRCTIDYSRGYPLNPEALVGLPVTKMFDGVEYPGRITMFKKWWQVKYDDGDVEDLNYRQLATLATPPSFDALKYPTPDVAAHDFLKAAKGVPSRVAVASKGGQPEEFMMEGATWTLISVYNVKGSKSPLQGAYIEEDDYCHDMRGMRLDDLQHKYPGVRVSPMGEIRDWINTSSGLEQLHCHENREIL